MATKISNLSHKSTLFYLIWSVYNTDLFLSFDCQVLYIKKDKRYHFIVQMLKALRDGNALAKNDCQDVPTGTFRPLLFAYMLTPTFLYHTFQCYQ